MTVRDSPQETGSCIDRFGPASRHRQRWQRHQLQNQAQHTDYSGNAKVLPQGAPKMYFLGVASRRCDMQQPPEKLSREAQSNLPQPLHAEADTAWMIASVSTPEITISRYADF